MFQEPSRVDVVCVCLGGVAQRKHEWVSKCPGLDAACCGVHATLELLREGGTR